MEISGYKIIFVILQLLPGDYSPGGSLEKD